MMDRVHGLIKRRHDARSGERSDGGFTLIELMVYSVILIVVMGIAAALFIQMLNSQRDVKALNDANNDAIVTFKQIENDLRNAQWAAVAAGGDLLVVQMRSATSTDSLRNYCVGYYYNDSTDTLLRTQFAPTGSGSNSATGRALAAGSDSQRRTITAGWNVARDGMGSVNGARVFGTQDGETTAPKAVEVNLRSDSIEGRSPIVFSKSVALRPQGAELSPDCR